MTDPSTTTPDIRTNLPEWIPNGRIARPDYLVRFADADGRRHDWHVRYDNFDGTGRRRHMAWHAWPDLPDPDLSDRPVWLSRGIVTAREEFLVRIVHGWQKGYGYAEGEGHRPIYGKDGVRRERKFVVAELTGRGVCPRCWKTPHIRANGTLNAHNRPRSLDRCSGSHGEPAAEGRDGA
jgi:hypothetical protein